MKKHFNLNNERNDLNKVIFQNSNKINNQIYKNKDLNLIERNIESPSTSEFTFDSNKKYVNLNNTDDLSKDKIHLFNTKNGNSNVLIQNNNKVVIPLIPLKRPSTNINFEKKNIWENKNNNTNEGKNIHLENLNDLKYKNRVKIYSAPHLNKDINQNNSNNNNNDIKNEINNIINNNNNLNINHNKNYSSEKLSSNLNKIKIEKGMMSSKIINLKQIPLKKRNNIFCQSINSFNLENKFMNNNMHINVITKKHPIRITRNLYNN